VTTVETNERKLILAISYYLNIRLALERIFEGAGYNLELTTTVESAVRSVKTHPNRYLAVALDSDLVPTTRYTENPITTAKRLREINPELPIVMLSSEPLAIKIWTGNSFINFDKPIGPAAIIAAVEQTLSGKPHALDLAQVPQPKPAMPAKKLMTITALNRQHESHIAEAIAGALDVSSGNIARAANLLGVPRSTLCSLMKKLEIMAD